jgi:hypothetical protein
MSTSSWPRISYALSRAFVMRELSRALAPDSSSTIRSPAAPLVAATLPNSWRNFSATARQTREVPMRRRPLEGTQWWESAGAHDDPEIRWRTRPDVPDHLRSIRGLLDSLTDEEREGIDRRAAQAPRPLYQTPGGEAVMFEVIAEEFLEEARARWLREMYGGR